MKGNGVVEVIVNDEDLSPMFYHKVMYRDFTMLMTCDAIYMMRGWENSSGASCELALAKMYDKEIFYEDPADKQKAYTRPFNFKPS